MAPLNEKTDLWLGTLFLVSGVVVLVVIVYLYSLVKLQRRHAYANAQHRRSKQQHGKELLQTQVDSADAERSRLAGELHDNIASSLAAIKFQLYAIDSNTGSGHAAPVISQVEQTLDEIALLSRARHEPQTQNGTLEESIRELVNGLNRAGLKTISLSYSANGRGLANEETQQLYRVFQELLHNSFKHSHTKGIRIEICIREDSLNGLYCEEDGEGYRPDVVSPRLGLGNISRRLALIGAVQEPLCLANGHQVGLRIHKARYAAANTTPGNSLHG